MTITQQQHCNLVLGVPVLRNLFVSCIQMEEKSVLSNQINFTDGSGNVQRFNFTDLFWIVFTILHNSFISILIDISLFSYAKFLMVSVVYQSSELKQYVSLNFKMISKSLSTSLFVEMKIISDD